ncbi:hypothetical protein G9U51_01220 [Calidifontibacter sp. DB0510]|uniref:Uncharacterized protein n=1 Tax=Metallococcus carri TaxID=1656884 RepID=A0A967AZ47_9MICO|nr:hypothetical protein [Metallococcus carri]NHN54403.1 hypothetical protein [Metallococcus carri]NOP36758.1 hypothetical protein [Calidifontibacter sp. DB2511S]
MTSIAAATDTVTALVLRRGRGEAAEPLRELSSAGMTGWVASRSLHP